MKRLIRKKYQKLLFACTLLLAFGAISYGNPLLAQSESSGDRAESALNKYPQNFIANYNNQCMELASGDLPKGDAQTLCKCTLREFKSRYTYEQYQELAQEEKEDIGLFCLEKLLYPDE